ncbi:MAG: transaldolase [Acidimicrobiia bacterium]
MSRLHDLCDEQGQSPWLDNLKRGWLLGGELAGWVDRAVRGITSNPTIFAKAIAEGSDYDVQFSALIRQGYSVEDAYWEMVIADIKDALAVLRNVHERSGGTDGLVSIEVAPGLAYDTSGTVAAAADLWARVNQPNLLVKIPGTAEGLAAVEQSLRAGISVNITLLFGVERYGQVIDAFMSGLEGRVADGHDVSRVTSVASFFVSRVDTEVDKRLEAVGGAEAQALQGRAAVANAKLAYELFQQRFSSDRWKALAAAGAQVQRPLWASTSVKNPDYPDTLYVDELVGPQTVNTMPESTLEAFEDHGTVARTIDVGLADARGVVEQLAAVGIDLADVTATLETEGVKAFAKSFDDLLETLAAKAKALAAA